MLGQHLGKHALDAQLARDSFCHSLAVTRQHRDLNAHISQLFDCLSALRADDIGNGDGGDDLVFCRQVYNRLRVVVRRVCKTLDVRLRRQGQHLQQARAADVIGFVIHCGLNTATFQCREVADRRKCKLSFPREPADCLGDQMLRVAFQGSRQGKGPVLLPAIDCIHVHDPELTLRERAGLIEDDYIDLARGFQCQAVTDKDAVARAHGCGNGNDERNCQTQGMRTGNHQHGDNAIENFDAEGLCEGPGDRGDYGSGQSDIEKPACCFVGQDLRSGFGLLCLLDQAHDSGQRGLTAGRRDTCPQAAVPVDGAGNDLAAGHFVDRCGLARDHRFTDIGMTLEHLTIRGNAGTRADEEEIAAPECGDGDCFCCVVRTDALGRVRHQFGQLVERP